MKGRNLRKRKNEYELIDIEKARFKKEKESR